MEKVRYSKYRWYVLIVMLLSTFSNPSMTMITPAPLVGIISESMGWKLGTVTFIIMGAFTFFIAAGCVLSAFLLDKIGISKTYIISCVLTAAGSFLVPVLATSVGGVLIVRLIQGIGGGLVLASQARIASEWFPLEERGIVTGFGAAGVGLGITVGLNLSPALYAATGSWHTAMALIGIAPVICLILSIVFMFGPEAPKHEIVEPQVSDNSKNESAFKLVLKEPLFYLMIIMTACFSWVQQGYGDLAPGYLAVDAPTGLGMGAQTAGSIFSVYSLAFMVGGLLSGFIGRYVFKNKLKVSIAVAFIISVFFHGSIMFSMVHTHHGLLSFCLIVAGFFFGWCNPMLFAYMTQCYPTSVTGRIGGLTQGIGTLGATLGVAVGSFALNMTGRYIVTMTIICIMLLLNFVLSFFLYKPKKFEGQAI